LRLTRERLEETLREFQGVKVAIVGDFYLDRYISGSMEAISREAAVPVVRIETDSYSPGAAGNTACNLASMGADVVAVGVIGDDLSGRIMREELASRGIDAENLLAVSSRHTATFNKVYASSYHGKKQQVGRFDQENDTPIGSKAEARIIEILKRLSTDCRVIVAADYAEIPDTGVVTKAILKEIEALSRGRGLLSIGDSRDRIAEFCGFSVLVPNDYEAAMAAGVYRPHESRNISDEVVLVAGRELHEITHCDTLCITRGERGMTVFPSTGNIISVPTMPCTGEVDATGAGDTVTAALALALSAGCDIVEAAELANLAAGTTVKKIGTTGSATHNEILAALDSLSDLPSQA
jgi:rfaE bifunctional protein kinase chain/domain